MDNCKVENARKLKLALWDTRTFKPIMTHDELEPIMSTLGFVGHPPKPAPNGVVWKEYAYTAARCSGAAGRHKWLMSAENGGVVLPQRPRLPYQRIDGHHIYTYRAFLDAVEFCLGMDDISHLLHVRGMPLHRVHDRKRKFRLMEEGEQMVFVYAEGSLEPTTQAFYQAEKNAVAADENKAHSVSSSMAIRSKDNTAVDISTVIPYKDIFV